MSLTQEDLQQIEAIFDRKLSPVLGELEALRNDVKEIYEMIGKLEKSSVVIGESFGGLPVKEQILQLNAAVVALAQKEGVTLPR